MTTRREKSLSVMGKCKNKGKEGIFSKKYIVLWECGKIIDPQKKLKNILERNLR